MEERNIAGKGTIPHHLQRLGVAFETQQQMCHGRLSRVSSTEAGNEEIEDMDLNDVIWTLSASLRIDIGLELLD